MASESQKLGVHLFRQARLFGKIQYVRYLDTMLHISTNVSHISSDISINMLGISTNISVDASVYFSLIKKTNVLHPVNWLPSKIAKSDWSILKNSNIRIHTTWKREQFIKIIRNKNVVCEV